MNKELGWSDGAILLLRSIGVGPGDINSKKYCDLEISQLDADTYNRQRSSNKKFVILCEAVQWPHKLAVPYTLWPPYQQHFQVNAKKNLSSDGLCKIHLQLGIGKTIVRFDSHSICMHTAAKFYLSFVSSNFNQSIMARMRSTVSVQNYSIPCIMYSSTYIAVSSKTVRSLIPPFMEKKSNFLWDRPDNKPIF